MNEGQHMSTWKRPVMSEWFEKQYGRHAFANLWEAYSGGSVFDVYYHTEEARRSFRDALDMMSIARVTQEEATVRHDDRRIRFASGGELQFFSRLRDLEEALRGRQLTRLDGRIYLNPGFADFLRSRGVELV